MTVRFIQKLEMRMHSFNNLFKKFNIKDSVKVVEDMRLIKFKN